MNSELRLFVWTNFCPDYTSGLAFAIAKDLPQAQRMIRRKMGYEPDWGTLTIHELNKRTAYAVHGGG